MRKNSGMKLMAGLLTVAMVLSATGCGGGSQSAGSTTAGTEAVKETQAASQNAETQTAGTETTAGEEAGGVTFPLAEPMTFDIMVPSNVDVEDAATRVPLLKKLEEMTNVKINWIALPTDTAMNNLNSLFTAGKEGDAIGGMKVIAGEGELVSMGSNGLIIPLEEYVDNKAIMPNFNERVLSESPETRGLITCPDGHIYSLPGYNAFQPDFLETPMWINTEWLKAVGEEMPASLEDLHRVLTKFKDADVNGNGDPNDEIPLMVSQNAGVNYVEGLLCLWGLATKDLPNDRYIDIKDGKCYYVGTSEAYREAIRTLASWYKEGLIWSEVYTGNRDTWSALATKAEAPVCGVAFTKDFPANELYRDQYEAIPPFSADGYEAKWWLHPGVKGDKGFFSITRSCEHPEILAAWIDLFYKFEIGIEAAYGVEGGFWDYNEDGKIVTTAIERAEGEYRETSLAMSIVSAWPGCQTYEDYKDRLALSPQQEYRQVNYELYKDVIGTEIWPRPYMENDITARINELYTDIDSTTDMYRANWITGVTDVDAEWDAYLETMKKIGIDEFVELHQRAYDVFQAGIR